MKKTLSLITLFFCVATFSAEGTTLDLEREAAQKLLKAIETASQSPNKEVITENAGWFAATLQEHGVTADNYAKMALAIQLATYFEGLTSEAFKLLVNMLFTHNIDKGMIDFLLERAKIQSFEDFVRILSAADEDQD